MDKRFDLFFAVLVIALGAGLYLQAANLAPIPVREPIGAAGVPKLMALFLVVGGLWLTFRRLATWRATSGWLVAAEGDEDDPAYPSSLSRMFVILALTIAYLEVLPRLGFLISTPLFLMVMLVAVGARKWQFPLGFAIGMTAILYAIFAMLFNVRLPAGPFS